MTSYFTDLKKKITMTSAHLKGPYLLNRCFYFWFNSYNLFRFLNIAAELFQDLSIFCFILDYFASPVT